MQHCGKDRIMTKANALPVLITPRNAIRSQKAIMIRLSRSMILYAGAVYTQYLTEISTAVRGANLTNPFRGGRRKRKLSTLADSEVCGHILSEPVPCLKEDKYKRGCAPPVMQPPIGAGHKP